jgi:hypothetical protein
MVPLGARSRQHLIALFSPEEQSAAEQMLLEWSGAYRDPAIPDTPEGWERVRIAVLRLCRGELATLKQAIGLAMTDWRDLLMAAGFADDIQAHLHWTVRHVTPEIVETWIAGGEIPDVDFRFREAVEVYGGEHPSGIRGSVVLLLDFEPEPQYLVELASGGQIHASQSWLWKAD